MITYKIIITAKADEDERSTYNYIAGNFGEIYAQQFRTKTLEVFEKLCKYPFIGRVAKNSNRLRVLIFNKQNKIIYKVTETDVIIVRILNTKTNLSSKY
ncbi:MAG: type II toxin-antitoxin system RelE/ParE family toxin [Chitinophagaceae bacterium]